MKKDLLFRLFPPPDYLAMPVVGIDISDRSVKFAKLRLSGGGFHLERFGDRGLPVGAVEGGEVKNDEILVSELRALRETTKSRYVVASLPEEKAYVVRLFLPNLRRRELHSALELQLEEYVPLKGSEVVFDYDVLREPRSAGEKYELAVSVFPRAVAEQYYGALTKAGFLVAALEIEAQAIARSVLRPADDTCLVVDFGKTRSSFFIVERNVVVFTATASGIGGESLTQALEKALNVDYAEAERLKISRGFLSDRQDKKMLFALAPTVSVLRDEIYKFYSYWTAHEDKEPRPRKINRVVLCGGQATLPGLLEYLSSSLKMEVFLADVWTNVLDSRRTVPPVSFNQSQRYATSLGLALRGFSHFSRL